MHTDDDSFGASQTEELDCSLHWLTQAMHDASKAGLPVQAKGIWSSPHGETDELLHRFSRIVCTHENSPPSVLSWLSNFENQNLQERIAEHPNTPKEVLHKLSRSAHPDVRSAVAENPSTPFELLFALSQDDHEDVRYRLAGNYELPQEILNILAEDENPYVADRARQSALKNSDSQVQSSSALKDRLTVLIVDDDDWARSALAVSLKFDPLINIVGQARNGKEGIKLAIEQQPDIVLMDIGMPGINGIAATAEIRAMVPSSKVIMVTANDSMQDIVSAFGHGAEGYHLKSTPNQNLAKAIRVVASGASWLDPAIASSVLRELSKTSISIMQNMSMAEDEGKAQRLSDPVQKLLAIVEEYVDAKNVTEARHICRAALSLSQTLYGDESCGTKKVMSRLAELYYLAEEYGICESTYLD
ncbi:MAG: response regulator transcription factor, partial [Candidatus Obscuribacterales bacterium]|nr:response regulator transcription factor [Candidatus Obscuribacterales bacterium]